ncbi:hypothetical protein D3C75_665900 [compost metagenome]
MNQLKIKAKETTIHLLREIDSRLCGTSRLIGSEEDNLPDLVRAAAELIKVVQGLPDIPKVPAYGSGGLAHSEGLVIVRDAGPEVVNPLAKLEEMLQRHFSHDVVIKVDNQELGLAAVKAINEVQRSAGRTLLPTKATEDTAALVKVIKNEMDWLKAVIAYAKRSNVDSDQFRQLLSKQEDSLYFYSQLLQSFESSPGD